MTTLNRSSRRQAAPKRSTVARRALLLTLLALPLLLALAAAPRAAQAQLTRTPLVAVLSFDNPAEPGGGGVLARQATDAVVVEMTRTGRWDAVPRAQLLQQIDDLGLPTPLDEIAIRKLGQALGADYAATGRVVTARYDESAGRARVTLAVLLTDIASGEPANGALVTGTAVAPLSRDSGDAATESLTLRALQNAAFLAVEQMNNYQLPEATVLTVQNDTVLINRGSRGGVTAGQEFVILRGRQRIGRVRVTQVSATDAFAVITDRGRGIRPEDRARAIFSLPSSGLSR